MNSVVQTGRSAHSVVQTGRSAHSVVQTGRSAHVVISEKVRVELDTTRIISGETPTPTVNGLVVLFTVSYPYVAGSLRVTRASLRMHPSTDYGETSPALGTFTMTVAPQAGEPLIVDYLKA